MKNMIYICFLDNIKSNYKEREKSFFEKILSSILSFIIPKANPDFDHLIYNVHQWYLEYDDLNKDTCREIGIDKNNRIIVKAAYLNNYGYWTDNNMTLEMYSSYFNIKYIDKDIFDSIWRLKLGAKIERDYGDYS
jgi:hypothetical protein